LPKKIIFTFYEFGYKKLSDEWLALREPIDTSWAILTEKDGYLRINGRDELFNFSGQSLIAKRGVNLSYQAETSVIFNPENYRQIAGLIVYLWFAQFYLFNN